MIGYLAPEVKKQIKWLMSKYLDVSAEERFDCLKNLITEAKFSYEDLLQLGIQKNELLEVESYLDLLSQAYVAYKHKWCDDRKLDYWKTDFISKEEFEAKYFQDDVLMANVLNANTFTKYEAFFFGRDMFEAFSRYEKIREKGFFNMLSEDARLAADLTKAERDSIVFHYSEYAI